MTRIIPANKVINAIEGLSIKANTVLRSDVLRALESAREREIIPAAKDALNKIIENARIAKSAKLAICQDTGLPFVLVEIGNRVAIEGDFKNSINQGILRGYKKGALRNSIVRDPLNREKPGFTPAVIHVELVKGSKLKLTLLPKGFGCENKSALKMLAPTAGEKEIAQFVIGTIAQAGADACPPYVVGLGIGGSSDYACYLAKIALLRQIRPGVRNPRSKDNRVYRLEKTLLKQINRLGIGPNGAGGKNTCLAVHIETYPTHIAGLAVCLNLSCHALRSACTVL